MTGPDPLRLTGVWPGETGTVDSDEYVPFSFCATPGPFGNGLVLLYDPEDASSMIELKVNLVSGRLTGATLVGFGGAPAEIPDDALAGLAEETGLPVFAQHGFDEDAIMPTCRLTAPISYARAPGTHLIGIAAAPPDRLVRCGAPFFLFRDDRLIGFGATGLRDVQSAAAPGTG